MARGELQDVTLEMPKADPVMDAYDAPAYHAEPTFDTIGVDIAAHELFCGVSDDLVGSRDPVVAHIFVGVDLGDEIRVGSHEGNDISSDTPGESDASGTRDCPCINV